MRRIPNFAVFVTAALMIGAGAGVADGAAAQGVPTGGIQLADRGPDRGPRFVSPPAPGTAAREDMSRAAVLRRRVSVTLVSVPLAGALDAIGRQVGLRFFYSRTVAPVDRPVSLNASDITVAAALTEILFDTGVDVELSNDGRAVLIARSDFIPVASRGVQPNSGMIAGRVMDAMTRAPLDQVSVWVEGPGLGAVTASDGRYAVGNVPPGTYRVTARRVGYAPLTSTATVTADSVATMNFALSAAPTRLTEMVTTAMGEQRRYEVGNVISTINADSIAPTAPITSLTDLISARAPGVTVEEAGGLTGSGETIRIRGQSSLVLQGDPIVIVDGVRQDNAPGGTTAVPVAASANTGANVVPSPSRLNDLNFADITSIDVLKGPTASTEYGTDAANGVIVITTKHGTAGRPQWLASVEATGSEIPVAFPTLYYSWGHTTDPNHTPVQCPLVPFLYSSGYGSSAGSCAVDSVTNWDPLNNSYYSIFGTGSRQKYGLSVGGGSEAVRYFVSGGLSNERGIARMPRAFVSEADMLGLPHSAFEPNGEDQRSVRATTVMRLGPTSDLAVEGAYLSTYQRSPNPAQLYISIYQTLPLRDSAHGYGYGGPTYDSPIYQFGQPTSQATNRLTGGLTTNWRPISWLVGHGTVGVDHGSQRSTSSLLPQVLPLNPTPYAPAQLGIANVTTDIYTVDLRGSATTVLTRALRAVTSAGLQLADRRAEGVAAAAKGITATNFTLNGAVSTTVTQLGNRQATLGGYGEEQLGLSDRLFLTGALRIDAGSGFGHAYSTAVYPKASVSWLAVGSGPTTVRFRGAFGESGVQPPNGAALQLYAATTDWLNGGATSTAAIANVQNQLLRPERSEEYEGGLDVGLWQNRLSVELTGYSKTTHDALVSTGTGWEADSYPYTENIGQIRNTGLEGAVTATVVQARGLTWNVTLNASINRNKLLALAPGVLSQQLEAYPAKYRFAPGYPLYGYWAPQVQYADLNHDGVLEPNEVTVADSLTYAGSSIPTREASVGMHIGLWGGAVSANTLVDYRGGFRLMNSSAAQGIFVQSDPASNDRSAPLWKQARDLGDEIVNVTGLNGYAAPAGFIEDATYLRFREVSVTYAVPQRVARALRLVSVSVTGAVRNLALWTRYTGVDPEVTNALGYNAAVSPTSNTFMVNNDMRADFAAVPLLRYWVVRVNAGL